MKVHRNILVEGKVQGVFFRVTAMNHAIMLGITGYVCNQSDGSVYIEAEGSPEAIGKYIEWCKEGPANANVTNVQVEEGKLSNYEEFRIQYGK